jgi:hypothetical protein
MTVRKAISATIGLLFALFAYFQHNDPDPWGWIVAYGYLAVMAFLAVAGRYHRPVFWLGLVAYAAGIIYLAPSVYEWLFHHREVSLLHGMAAKRMYIEESRECLGLLLALAALTYLYSGAPKQ